MMRTALALAFVGGVAVLSAQSPPVVQAEPPLAFEAASIKPSTTAMPAALAPTKRSTSEREVLVLA